MNQASQAAPSPANNPAHHCQSQIWRHLEVLLAQPNSPLLEVGDLGDLASREGSASHSLGSLWLRPRFALPSVDLGLNRLQNQQKNCWTWPNAQQVAVRHTLRINNRIYMIYHRPSYSHNGSHTHRVKGRCICRGRLLTLALRSKAGNASNAGAKYSRYQTPTPQCSRSGWKPDSLPALEGVVLAQHQKKAASPVSHESPGCEQKRSSTTKPVTLSRLLAIAKLPGVRLELLLLPNMWVRSLQPLGEALTSLTLRLALGLNAQTPLQLFQLVQLLEMLLLHHLRLEVWRLDLGPARQRHGAARGRR